MSAGSSGKLPHYFANKMFLLSRRTNIDRPRRPFEDEGACRPSRGREKLKNPVDRNDALINDLAPLEGSPRAQALISPKRLTIRGRAYKAASNLELSGRPLLNTLDNISRGKTPRVSFTPLVSHRNNVRCSKKKPVK